MTLEKQGTLIGVLGLLIILSAPLFPFALWFILLIPLAMWLALKKNGDERRKIILLETCSWCFVVEVLLHTLEILTYFLADMMGSEIFLSEFTQLASPVARLFLAALLFWLNFSIMKKKHGG